MEVKRKTQEEKKRRGRLTNAERLGRERSASLASMRGVVGQKEERGEGG